jgi:hypothetical protein
MWRAAAAEDRRLLRFLLIWLSFVPAGPGGAIWQIHRVLQ